VTFRLDLNSETVDQCYPTEPVCLTPADTAAEAVRRMREQHRGAVLVCQGEAVVGIFTERDVLKMMVAQTSFNAPLSQHMTSDPVVLRASDSVGRAITMMARGGYRRLPVVDNRGQPTGIVSVKGILHYLVEHFPATIYNLPPKPHQTLHEREGA
jgi:CBS domain-containing protein